MNRILNFFLDLIYPISCVSCGKAGSLFCDDCLKTIKVNRSEKQAYFKPEGQFIDTVYVVADYHQPALGSLIHCYKYKFVKGLASVLAELVIDFLKDNKFYSDCLIALPTAKKRLLFRGFDHTLLVAKSFSAQINVAIIENVLLRKRYRRPQVGLSRQARLINIRDAFAVINPALVADKNILLFDDIYTTGSTLSQAAKMLKLAGAKKVEALVIARD
ncbi:MAG: ComF family protein [Candidatus Buchananbacteria bacterium]|nr:ComF family protein [Candidatus Buchananbacteria bacterium]